MNQVTLDPTKTIYRVANTADALKNLPDLYWGHDLKEAKRILSLNFNATLFVFEPTNDASADIAPHRDGPLAGH